MQTLTSPESFFGFVPGGDRRMIRWDRLCAYYTLLSGQSDRMRLIHMGDTSEGNPFLAIIVSSADNLKNLEEYRRISLKMADPRGLSLAEIDAMAKRGKAVCMQNYSLHSNEVGGAQMAPILLYDLLSARDGPLARILENVIFILVPCGEPDGQIVFTDWYEKYRDTEFDGVVSPYLRHNWAGHSNNRDAVTESVVESRYLNDLMIRSWMPQAYQDHHHQCPYEDRMSIAPQSNPIFPGMSPLLLRETACYGAAMARALEEAGRKGVVSGDESFNAFPITSFYNVGMLHNIAGMLTESADAMIASPVFVHPEQQTGHTIPSIQCPNPWEGGWWRLSDIVEQQYIVSVALLSALAQDPARALLTMAKKALGQTERGAKSREQAYLIPERQNDPSAARHMLDILLNHRVDIFIADEDITLGAKVYPKGTAVIPLAQPKYAFIDAMLGMHPYPDNRYTQNPDGSIRITDTANINIALGMGVVSAPAMADIGAKLSRHQPKKDAMAQYPLLAKENESFRLANIRLNEGLPLWRDGEGSFCDCESDGGIPVRAAKVGLLKKSATWNEEEGYTRTLLRQYHFDYRIVMDREIRERAMTDIDVLILPGDDIGSLKSGDMQPAGMPPEHRSGLGEKGAERLRAFVENGGRLIAWEKSCAYVIEVFRLHLKDKAKGLTEAQFHTHGSVLRARFVRDALTAGMPEEVMILHWSGPALHVLQNFQTMRGGYETLGRIAKEDVLVNGYLKGEEIISDTPCMLRVAYGKGEIILYTFDPKFRAQTDGTYKLLFNALYV